MSSVHAKNYLIEQILDAKVITVSSSWQIAYKSFYARKREKRESAQLNEKSTTLIAKRI